MKTTQFASKTPLNDFIAKMVDPLFLNVWRSNPKKLLEEEKVASGNQNILLSGNRGYIRVEAIKELERAGLSPLISDRFAGTSGGTAEMNLTFTFNTNNFNTNNTTIPTTVTTNSTTFTDNFTTSSSNDSTTSNTTTSSSWQEFSVEVIDQSIRYFSQGHFAKNGSLAVVGSGIKAIKDLTLGAEAQIRAAEKVFYCVADPVTERRLHSLNSSSETLYDLYGNDKPRIDTYKEMLEKILQPVRNGKRVCAVFYGHPGVYAWATHQAIRIARNEGHRAEMEPSVSAEDSLFADLGLDPANFGVQTLDATDFLIRNRKIDTSSHVILWQIECVGDPGFNFSGYKKHNVKILVEALCDFYPLDHPVVLYDAAQLPLLPPRILKIPLRTLSKDHLSGTSTLYLPPATTPPVDQEMLLKLGLN